MTAPARQVVIRPPLLVRAYVAAFAVFWVGSVIWTTAVRHHGSTVVFGVAFAAFGATLAWRLVQISVRSEPGGTLKIHNNFGSKRLNRADIEEFRVGHTGGGRLGQRNVQAILRDGTTYGLDVCRGPSALRRQRSTVQVDQLNAWLRDSS